MPSVFEIQSSLNAAGYGPLAVDGILGNFTRNKIKLFQRNNHLMSDGIVGPKTWAALQTAARPTPVAKSPPKVATGSFLTEELIRKIAPKARKTIVDAMLSGVATAAFIEAGIMTPNNMAFFFSQACPETKDLQVLEESLNYSVAGLRATFGRHRITDAQCAAYGRAPGRRANQEMIANIVYGGDWGNRNLGNNQPGDGWRHRGSGLFQTTGRANYRRAGAEANPENLRKPLPAVLSAIKFWKDNRLSAYADRNDILGMRKRVNGGLNGLDHSRQTLAVAKAVFGA